MHRSSLRGNREISRLTSDLRIAGPHREGRVAEADGERTGEVGFDRSSEEAEERHRAAGGGGGGAKDRSQGERGPDRHAPDTAPDQRVPRTGARTTSSKGAAKGTVHGTPPPSRCRPAALGLFPAQAGSGSGDG